jgi:Mg/Co/Ni transporter MgtE
LESLETETAADIVEEMSPDEAADVLAELKEETSDEILEEMESQPKADVEELMEFDEDTAGGMMNTEYVRAARRRDCRGRAACASKQRRAAGESQHAVSDRRGGAAERRGSLARLFLHEGATPLKSLAAETLIS